MKTGEVARGTGPGTPVDRQGTAPQAGRPCHPAARCSTAVAHRPLPVLRRDIEFLPGPDESDGSPTYILHDPLSGTFERATWVQGEILGRLRTPRTLDGLLADLQRSTTVRVSPEDVLRLCEDAAGRGLTADAVVLPAPDPPPTPPSGSRRDRGLSAVFRRVVFLRVPLLRPDAWLGRTVGYLRPLGSRAALAVYGVLGLAALLLLAQRFDAYLATFSYFFSISGVIAFGLTIAAVKTLHELAHAYVAKALGARVRTMGVVLIFLFPVAYSDVTDSWRLRRRRERLWIALAGVLAELVLAAVGVIVWSLAPPGLLKSVCFVVSSVTLLSTLLLNLNPGMRYDGYYVLSELLGIDNLQGRSFAWTRWTLRRHLLGMDVAAPEVGPAARRGPWLVVYALYAWAYRLFLYTAIALMLYHRVTKAVGAVLFVVALHVFLIQPLLREVTSVWKSRHLIKRRPRAAVTAAGLAALGLWLALPLPRWAAAPAVSVARDSQIVYAPGTGELRALDVRVGQSVRHGQVLCVVASEDLAQFAELARLEVERLRLELDRVPAERIPRALLPQKNEELARALAKQESLQAALARNRCVALVDGTVLEWDESLREGTPVGIRQELGRIVDPRVTKVVCYVPHDRAGDVALGRPARFCSDAGPGRLNGAVTFVDTVRAEALEHRGLASVAGGPIAVVSAAQGRLEPVESLYAIEITLDDPPVDLRVGQTGRVWLRTAPRSRVADLLRYGYRVLVRESSF